MEINGINHLAFITPDLPATIRFYRDLLGMRLEAGIGHDGYRHYFFRLGPNQVAFFAYEGARAMELKPHGVRTEEPRGFDHVSFTVESCEALFALKDRLEAAGIEVTGAIDHGTIWSIYFYDPNNLPLEASWDCVEIQEQPVVSDDVPLEIVAEGPGPQPGHWPEPTRHTPRSEWVARPGNGFDMREALIRDGRGRLKPELEELLRGRTATKPGA